MKNEIIVPLAGKEVNRAFTAKKRFLYLTVALLCAVMSVQANDYLEQSGHYTVMNMGNGVYRFYVPVWVYGAWTNYYLESSNDRDNNDDSYIWYSEKPNQSRGSSDVHRIATVRAIRVGKNKINNYDGEGEGQIYVHEGSVVIQNMFSGEMIAAVADTEAIRSITSEWLAKRSGEINLSEYVVADTNMTEDSIRWLMENVTAPLFIDGVSSTKAHRVVNALRKCKLPYLHTLKLNLKEALAVTQTATYAEAAQALLNLGVAHVYITLGPDGVYCRNAAEEWLYPILPGEIVNTTGAGDAFLAGVVFAYLKGIDFPKTAQYGLMAARATLMSPKAVNPDIANILL